MLKRCRNCDERLANALEPCPSCGAVLGVSDPIELDVLLHRLGFIGAVLIFAYSVYRYLHLA